MKSSTHASRFSGHRELTDFLLASLCVIFLFRVFVAEPLQVMTSSMAPTFWGGHLVSRCEHCGEWLRRPLQAEDGAVTDSSSDDDSRCPRCGATVSFEGASPEGGDRVLVQKGVEGFSPFDVIVFKCPDSPRKTFVKRVIGLPGETIRIHEGDVQVLSPGEDRFITRCKPIDLIDETSVLFHAETGSSVETHRRWVATKVGAWRSIERGYEAAEPGPGLASLVYPSAVGTIGDLKSAPVAEVPDAESPWDWIVDFKLSLPPAATFFRVTLRSPGEEGHLRWRRGGGWELVHASVPLKQAHAGVEQVAKLEPIRGWEGREQTVAHNAAIRLARVDRRLVAWVDGTLAGWTRLPEPGSDLNRKPPRHPVEIVADGMGARVTDLVLRRDIHYRQASLDDEGNGLRGDAAPLGAPSKPNMERVYRLGEGEFFVLGDNSAASNDSRHWVRTFAVPERMILGRVVGRIWPGRRREGMPTPAEPYRTGSKWARDNGPNRLN